MNPAERAPINIDVGLCNTCATRRDSRGLAGEHLAFYAGWRRRRAATKLRTCRDLSATKGSVPDESDRFDGSFVSQTGYVAVP